MNNRLKNIDHFKDAPIVGIIRNLSSPDLLEVLSIYYESGLRLIEITMNTPGAVDLIKLANKYFSKKLVIGAGTVCTKTELVNSLKAGARFIVTPVLDETIINACLKKDIPIFPGAFTPTEIYKAWSSGASLVKVFPSTSLGVQYIKDIKAPLNTIELMPTGGIDHKNIALFFQAGAAAVGVGSKLFDKAMITEKNWNGLMNHFVTYINALKNTGKTSFLKNVSK